MVQIQSAIIFERGDSRKIANGTASMLELRRRSSALLTLHVVYQSLLHALKKMAQA